MKRGSYEQIFEALSFTNLMFTNTEDIPGDISLNNISVLKKIIAFLATSTVPKVSPTNLSKELAISKNTLYSYLDLLEKSGLIRKYLPHGSGKRKLRSGETEKQIADLENGFLLKDGIEIGFGKHIPLFLAGFLR